MSKGVLLFASNNKEIDYIKQAIYCAKRIKKYIGVDVTIATPNSDYLKDEYPFYTKYIDNVIHIRSNTNKQVRKYHDGDKFKSLPWDNYTRADAFTISPYDETVVIDTDLVICNDGLAQCFESTNEFLISRYAVDLHTGRDNTPELRVSDITVPMYWATAFYFKKTEKVKTLFDTIQYVKENWQYYRLLYNISSPLYRNDYAFSIAIHIMSDNKPTLVNKMPHTLWMCNDKDTLIDIKDEQIQLLLNKDSNEMVCNITNADVHVMNKFSLNRYIDKEFEYE